MFKAKSGCCEEASIFSREFYIPCNITATKLVYSDRDKINYRMCEPCSSHNIKNRKMKLIGVRCDCWIDQDSEHTRAFSECQKCYGEGFIDV